MTVQVRLFLMMVLQLAVWGAWAPTLFPYSTIDEAAGVEAIWNEHRESTRGRDLDITGMSYGLLEQSPLQWPILIVTVVSRRRRRCRCRCRTWNRFLKRPCRCPARALVGRPV